MKRLNYNWIDALNWLSLSIILLTGILQFQNPQGGLLWGYIVGILLTLITNKKGYIISAFILSAIFILVSFFQIPKEATVENPWLIRTYGGIGLVITLLFILLAIARERKGTKSKAQMTAIFSHGTQGIILSKKDGTIQLVNPFTEKLFGYSSTEIVGKKVNLLLPDFLLMIETERTEMSNHAELTALTKNGHSFTAEISINQYESNGESYVVAFITDITSRKRNEETLHAQKRELEIVNKELEAFSYSVSHDLRSPLRAVGGYAQLLEEEYGAVLDEEGKRLLSNIQMSALRMGTLIDDLLTFSKLGKKELNKSWVDMDQLIQQVLAEINQTIKHDAIILIDSLQPVMADYSLILNVMINLLSNAIKYSSKSKSPRVEINSQIENDNVIYCVRDNGVGFDMRYVHKLFGVFQRLHTEKEFEGTGVGLATAQRIIQKHGGKIWAEGKEDAGATFCFSIPLVQRDQLNNPDRNAEDTRIVQQRRVA